MAKISRRALIAGAAGWASAKGAIETHVHLFDPARVPYAAAAPYRPAAYTLEQHVALARAVGLRHSIVVHPEPYQDDHRYLEYCFAHEPSPGYFRASCLFDPFREDTPRKLRELTERWPNRIVSMRIHEVAMAPEAAGAIKNRDMRDPRMAACWKMLEEMRLAVQMHCIPGQAANIRALAAATPKITVLIDHMGRPGQGTPEEFENMLRLSELPGVTMKFSGWEYYKGDLAALTKRIYRAFGAGRMVWGTLGNTAEEYAKRSAQFEELLAFAPKKDRDRIRGGNAQRMFFA